LPVKEENRRQDKGIPDLSTNRFTIHSLSFLQSYQLYKTLLAHLTTSIVDIVEYLEKNQNARGLVHSVLPFSPLTEKKLVERVTRSSSVTPPTKVPLKEEATSFLTSVNWSQDDFIDNYIRVFQAMIQCKEGLPKEQRLARFLAVRILATTGLSWPVDSKSRARDWSPIAKAIVIETALVESYREKLIIACPRVRVLRKELLDFFLTLAPVWTQFDRTGPDIALTLDRCWNFADEISVANETPIPPIPQPKDQEAIRSEIQLKSSQKPPPKRKPAAKKSKAIIISDTEYPPPEEDQDPTPKDASTTTATKDGATQKRSDDIQSLLSALKTIQKHKLVQCSDPEAPSGNTESIVSFAASIIGNVCFISIFIAILNPI
jgi:hypothetical protein